MNIEVQAKGYVRPEGIDLFINLGGSAGMVALPKNGGGSWARQAAGLTLDTALSYSDFQNHLAWYTYPYGLNDFYEMRRSLSYDDWGNGVWLTTKTHLDINNWGDQQRARELSNGWHASEMTDEGYRYLENAAWLAYDNTMYPVLPFEVVTRNFVINPFQQLALTLPMTVRSTIKDGSSLQMHVSTQPINITFGYAIHETVTFYAKDQSMWGTGDALNLHYNKYYDLINVPTSEGTTNIFDILGISMDAYGKFGFKLGVGFEYTATTGVVNGTAIYDIDVVSIYDRGHDTIYFKSYDNLHINDSSFSTQSPLFELRAYLGLSLDLDFDISLNGTSILGIPGAGISLDQELNLFAISSSTNMADSQAMAALNGTMGIFGIGIDYLACPNIKVTPDQVRVKAGSTDTLVATGKGLMATLVLDVDKIYTLFTKIPFSIELDNKGLPFSLELSLLNAQLQLQLSACQDFVMKFNSLRSTIILEDGFKQDFVCGDVFSVQDASAHDINHDGLTYRIVSQPDVQLYDELSLLTELVFKLKILEFDLRVHSFIYDLHWDLALAEFSADLADYKLHLLNLPDVGVNFSSSNVIDINRTGLRLIDAITDGQCTANNDLIIMGSSSYGAARIDTMNGLGGQDEIRYNGNLDTNPLTSNTLTLGSGVSNIEYITIGTGRTDLVDTTGTASLNVDGSALTVLESGGVTITGNSGNNVLTGGAGDCTLIGGIGSDRLIGGMGNDKLIGGEGSDYLFGGLGTNILVGGAGNDTMVGGLGADTFLFSGVTALSNGADTITFVASAGINDDTLEFNLFAVKAATGAYLGDGAIAAANFVSGAGAVATTVNQYFIYDTTNGALSFDADGSGAGAAVQLATLVGHPTITTADIVLH